MIEPIREKGLRQSNQCFNLALFGHFKIFVREPDVRAVWGRCVSKYSIGSGSGGGGLDGSCHRCFRKVCWTVFGGHVVPKCCWAPLQPIFSCTGVCSPSVFAWEKENGYVQVGVEAVVLKQSWRLAPKRELLIPYYLRTVLTVGSAKRGFLGASVHHAHTETPTALSSKEVWPLNKKQRICWLTQATGRNSQRPHGIGRLGVADGFRQLLISFGRGVLGGWVG